MTAFKRPLNSRLPLMNEVFTSHPEKMRRFQWLPRLTPPPASISVSSSDNRIYCLLFYTAVRPPTFFATNLTRVKIVVGFYTKLGAFRVDPTSVQWLSLTQSYLSQTWRYDRWLWPSVRLSSLINASKRDACHVFMLKSNRFSLGFYCFLRFKWFFSRFLGLITTTTRSLDREKQEEHILEVS